MYNNRVEEIPVRLELEADAAKRHALALKVLLKRDDYSDLLPGDIVKIDWTLFCGYLGDVAIQLEALGSLCDDPDIVVTAECDPLMEGEILVYEVLHKLKKLIKKVKKRKDAREHEPWKNSWL